MESLPHQTHPAQEIENPGISHSSEQMLQPRNVMGHFLSQLIGQNYSHMPSQSQRSASVTCLCALKGESVFLCTALVTIGANRKIKGNVTTPSFHFLIC